MAAVVWKVWIPHSKTEQAVVYECRNPGEQNPTWERVERTHAEVMEMMHLFKSYGASTSNPPREHDAGTRSPSELCEASMKYGGTLVSIHQEHVTSAVRQDGANRLRDSERAFEAEPFSMRQIILSGWFHTDSRVRVGLVRRIEEMFRGVGWVMLIA